MNALYLHKPFVLVNKDNVVLAAGDKEYIAKLSNDSYYADCKMEARKHDLYMIDNTKKMEA